LAEWLSQHPAIYFSPRKEPHYFNTEGIVGTATQADYEALFANAGPQHRAVGEGSTHYLYSPVAVGNILAYQPEARFIVSLRNPVEMAPALHDECLRQGWETERSFAKAWALQAGRREGRGVPATARRDPDRLLYGPYCQLGQQLERLYNQVSADRVLTLLVDDLRGNPAVVYRQCLEFLGVDDDGRQAFPVVNSAPRTKSVLLSQLIRRTSMLRDALCLPRDWGLAKAMRRLNTATGDRPPLPPALKDELADYFAADIAKLEGLVRRDLSGWHA